MESFHRLLEQFEWFIAGLLGAVAAAWWHKEDFASPKGVAIFLFSGALCAHYLTGLVSGYFGIIEPRSVAGVGFLIGAFGGSLICAITRAIKTADLWEIIRQRFGGGR